MAVFDFDHTVVDQNTDIVVRDLVSADKIPSTVTSLYKRSGWISYMQEIFHILHSHGFRQIDIQHTIEAIPEVRGLTHLIRQLHDEHNFDVVILSDSNSEFIRIWCERHGVKQWVHEVFTNPAHFDIADGRLLLQPHHHQTSCSLSSQNLCKGAILEGFVDGASKRVTEYEVIFYVGDGENDLCPILRLGKNDYGCVRRGYSLERQLEKLQSVDSTDEMQKEMDATLLYWDNGTDLLNLIVKNIQTT